jgi:hypothetical protein
MISHRVPFAQFHEALSIAADPGKAAKVMLIFS